MPSTLLRLIRSPVIWTSIAAVALIDAIVVFGVYTEERSSLRARERGVVNPDSGSSSPTHRFIPFVVPGLRDPQIVSAAVARIGDKEPVVGIVVNGKPRAYSLKALTYPPWHVVNDVINGTPATVTFCDQSNCSRVYAGPESSGPLDISVAGRIDGEMIVKVDMRLYYQGTGRVFNGGADEASVPYTVYPSERMTWKEWRQLHPDTDVFLGQGETGARF